VTTTVSVVQQLRTLLGPRLVLPGEPHYEQTRRVWNSMHDRRPALIARCTTAAEVSQVLRHLRTANLPVTVRGGGHNVAGAAVADDAGMVDLSLMREVTVDPAAGLAHAQGGALLRDLDAATTPHGLACPAGVVSHTGLGGLALGGGYGWLARKWGLTCDHIVAAEVVLADGSVVVSDDTEHPDLLWALRGGGGNFGVVTRFTLRLRPVEPILLHTGVYGLDEAAHALAAYAEFAENQTNDLHAVGAAKIAGEQSWLPDELRGRPVLYLTAAWLGEAERGPNAIESLPSAARPAARLDRVLSYAELQALGDHSEPHGNRYYTKSCYLTDLDAVSVPQIVEAAADITSPLSSIDFEFLRGAISSVPDEDSAFPRRDAPYILTASAQWTRPEEDDHHIGWTRRTVDRLSDRHFGGAYVNYLQDEPGDRVLEVYGEPLYRRLAEVKRRYDPDNVLRHNQNVTPATRY